MALRAGKMQTTSRQIQGDQMCPFQDEDRKANIQNKENHSQLFLRLKMVRQGTVFYSEGSQSFRGTPIFNWLKVEHPH